MTDPQRKLSAAELAKAGLIGWRVTGESLAATFRTRKFSTDLELVNRIGASAEEADHHPSRRQRKRQKKLLPTAGWIQCSSVCAGRSTSSHGSLTTRLIWPKE